MLFPAIEEHLKDKKATYSYDSKNFYLNAIREIKKQFPEFTLMSDVAMDPYSSDGHDGYVENGKIINDITLPILGKMSIAQAEAGIDIVGPSNEHMIRYKWYIISMDKSKTIKDIKKVVKDGKL